MKQAVILAAGWGTRMRPLSYTRPKPALKIAGKTLLEYNLDQLVDLVDEVVIVVGYQKEIIQEELGQSYKGITIKYAEQQEQLGTGDAARSALEFLEGQFLILNGDDLYRKEDLQKGLTSEDPCILVQEVQDPSGFGQVVHENGRVKDLVEKPRSEKSKLVNIGAYVVDKDFFDADIHKSTRGEFEITDYIKKNLSERHVCYQKAQKWDFLSYPWNLLESTKHIFEDYDFELKGKLEEGVVVKGDVYLGEGSIVKAGARIEGPVYIGENCVIGPNSHIKKRSSIGRDSKVGAGVEITNSIIGEETEISKGSYISNSVLGDKCKLGSGVKIPSELLKDQTIETEVKGETIDTGRDKLGAIVGDEVTIGVDVCLMPGIKIGPNSMVYPNTVIDHNLNKNAICKNE